MHRIHSTILLLSLWPLLIDAPAFAGTTVLVIDRSASMTDACPGSDPSPAEIAHDAVAGLLRSSDPSGEGETIGLVAFSRTAQIISEPVRDTARILLLAGALVPEQSADQTALHEALRLARSLLPPAGGRILVFSHALATQGLLDTLALPGGRIETHVRLIGGSGTAEIAEGVVRIERLTCGAPGSRGTPAEAVIGILGDGLGLPVDLLRPDVDLVADLGVDRTAVYQAVAAVCDALGVPLPPTPDLTRVGDIIGHAEAMRTAAGTDATETPRAAITPPKPVALQTIFYATDRRSSGDPDPYRVFGGERESDAALHYGRCEVSIPVSVHRPGAVESPFLDLKFLRDPERHIILQRVEPMPRDGFFGAIRDALQREPSDDPWAGDLLVFIHGFNTRFDQAARQTAQIAYDIDFSGAPLMFSWPSYGRLTAYLADRENIEWSVVHIERFLDELAHETPYRRLHVIAHSMGNEGLLRALSFLALRHARADGAIFENVILAAPDFDARIFIEQYLPRIQHLARRWTLYASDKDQALNLSTALRQARRLGLPLPVAEGIDTIDATGIEVTPWSVPEFHSYYTTKRQVMQDLISVLKGYAPRERALVEHRRAGLPYWAFRSAAEAKPTLLKPQ